MVSDATPHGTGATRVDPAENGFAAVRAAGPFPADSRLDVLLDAVLTMAADLTLDGALERIVRVAGELVGAEYVALGVLDTGSERRLRTFVHQGIDAAGVERIGRLPTGHGILGLLIDVPEPLRLHDIAAHPASFGFPPHHPPMSSFLGVPIRSRGEVFGNLYLTEKRGGGDFTDADEAIALALASAAGVLVANVRLYERATDRERWLEASAAITTALVEPSHRADGVQVVADLSREVARADVSWIVSGTTADELVVVAVSGEPGEPDALRLLDLRHSLASEVVTSGNPLSVSDIASDPRAVDVGAILGWPELGPVVVVPLGAAGAVEGVLALAWRPEHAHLYEAVDPVLPASFAQHAALALQVARNRRDQERLVVLADRDRIGRDLHDLVIQRLFAVGLGLQATARALGSPDAAGRLEQAVDDLDATVKDIRRTIFSLGSVDSDADVQSEVTRMVDRAAATLKFRPRLRLEGPVRTMIPTDVVPDLLAVLGEALSNASRHAEATEVEVLLAVATDLRLEVRDDGRGLPAGVVESGLRNIRDRARRHGGSLTVESAPGAGTHLVWQIPLRRV